ARAGIPSSSNFDKIVTTKGVASKSAQKYMYQLAGEKITGLKAETYQSKIMEQASITEGEARDFYELVNDVKINQVGFCYRDDRKLYGASPDGLIGDDGLVEIKCPLLSTHVGYLLEAKLPTDYFQQVKGQLLVTGRKWVDFVSYYPGIKPLMVRVVRDEGFIASLNFELDLFCAELKQITEKIR
ncbi:MAG TPA: exonuclease, partial [bacterium]|nr:exonuclease [bacterium]